MPDDLYPETLLETREPEGGDEETGNGVITAEVLKQILDDNRKANADIVERVAGRRAEAGVPLQRENIIPEVNFSLEGLPDPGVDPRRFHEEYTKRWNAKAVEFANGVQQRVVGAANQAISDARVRDRVDGLIRQAIPGITDAVMGTAAGVVAGRYRAAGRDPMTELRSRPEEIAQEIVDYVDDLATQVGAKPREERQEDLNDGRTAGLVQPRARQPQRPQRERAERNDPNEFYKSLTKTQREARIY